jgi:hypothetical protein
VKGVKKRVLSAAGRAAISSLAAPAIQLWIVFYGFVELIVAL